MGYYTDYYLSVRMMPGTTDPSENTPYGDISALVEDALEKEIDKMNVFEDGRCEDGWSANCVKWYDHDDDMLLLSRRFPEVLFELEGNGDDRDDMWTAYYNNGRMQYCGAEIVYPPFDASKLAEIDAPRIQRYSYQPAESAG